MVRILLRTLAQFLGVLGQFRRTNAQVALGLFAGSRGGYANAEWNRPCNKALRMLLQRQINIKHLAEMCRRASTALEAGVDIRTFWRREAQRGPAWFRLVMERISLALEQGTSLYEAMQPVRSAFPELAVEMIDVGESSGKLGEVFRRLAEHYDEKLRFRRTFWARATWPAIQLIAALAVIGIVILVNGWLRTMPGNESLDMLGWGLVGVPGFVAYLAILALAAGAGVYFVRAVQVGALSMKPVQYGILHLPVVGENLRILALSHLAWSLEVTLGAGMEVKRSLALALRATHWAPFLDVESKMNADIDRGREIHEAMEDADVFPRDFLDAVEVGEQSGRLPETMATISRSYQEQARSALSALANIAGFLVWAVVALFIISIIFRLFSGYVGIIQGLSQP